MMTGLHAGSIRQRLYPVVMILGLWPPASYANAGWCRSDLDCAILGFVFTLIFACFWMFSAVYLFGQLLLFPLAIACSRWVSTHWKIAGVIAAICINVLVAIYGWHWLLQPTFVLEKMITPWSYIPPWVMVPGMLFWFYFVRYFKDASRKSIPQP